jgi:hypothetical protein
MAAARRASQRQRHGVVRTLATADRMLNEGKDIADVCRELQVVEDHRALTGLSLIDLGRQPLFQPSFGRGAVFTPCDAVRQCAFD